MTACAMGQAAPEVDDSPTEPGEWGFHPQSDRPVEVTPPGFAWRPQERADSYELQCSRDEDFATVGYAVGDIEWNVHCPPRTLETGAWYWRYRYRTTGGEISEWSIVRSFTIADDATPMPIPEKEDLLARVPDTHPRLFVRPEQIDELRRRAQTDLKPLYDKLVASSENLLANPPPTEEPPTYPQGMKRGSDPWRSMWWGNRTYTSAALNGAATLAFTRLLGGNEAYGQLARKILLECAAWDPKGATGYRYNDEAGMPYAYYFSRTYTFVNDLLTEAEKETCRQVMTVRGREMYKHLSPRHLWHPYSSHSNRAWHFLGEVGIAFKDEIPEAGQWAWFAVNVFANVYPVWSDEDGGWHEGSAYWSSYIGRFTWWADVMREAMGINAYDKPYFSSIGYYPMYLQPPGTLGGGFGDLTARRSSGSNRGLMTVLAAQAGNPYWQWYVKVHGGPTPTGGYIGFVRGALPDVEAKAPVDLPTSRCFRGTGQAMLNATLMDAKDNVEIIFKASPFGTQSHGYESQNAFLLYAFGERLLIRTGRRDSYGTNHHRNWMWQTKSVNSITVNGEGQQAHSRSAVGRISQFVTTRDADFVEGEAAPAYKGKLKRFTRRILYIKPEVVIIHDLLEAPEPSTFEWLLHAPVEIAVNGQYDVRVVNDDAACRTSFLWPEGLTITTTDQFDPPPRERIKLTEYHLTAQTPGRQATQEFVTVLRPYRTERSLQGQPSLKRLEGGFEVTVPMSEDRVLTALLNSGEESISGSVLSTSGTCCAVVTGPDGTEKRRFVVGAE